MYSYHLWGGTGVYRCSFFPFLYTYILYIIIRVRSGGYTRVPVFQKAYFQICYDTGLFHPDPPLLPLRTSDLDTEFYHTDMKVLADHFHGQPTTLYCVPTNPGPRSFHAWAIRRCHWPVPQPIVQLLKPGPLKSTNQYPISPDPEYLGPRESISDKILFFSKKEI